jgi:hypothetical protein
MFGKLLSKVQSIFGADKVVSGVVVATSHHLPLAPGSGVATIGTGKNERFVQLPMVPGSESWSVTVEGVDKRGNKVKEEIYVNWDVWSTAKVGDKYP